MRPLDYECKTTFRQDFTTAELFGGEPAIRDTFRRAFREWKSNTVYLTELVMVLNHKIWQWHERNEARARLYNDLWEKASLYAEENLTGDDLEYYFRITD